MEKENTAWHYIGLSYKVLFKIVYWSFKIAFWITFAPFLFLFSNRKKKGSSELRIPISGEVQKEVWNRDGGKCVRCGNRESHKQAASDED